MDVFSAAMEGTFPSDFVVEARAMPQPSPTSITILSSPTLLPGKLNLIAANAATKRPAAILTACSSINQSMYFKVLGVNWDPTNKRFSSVNSYRQNLLPTCKAFPEETTTCIWFTQSHQVCDGTTVLQEA